MGRKEVQANMLISVPLPAKSRSWPVRATAVLLLLQAIGLGGYSVYRITHLDWSFLPQEAEIIQDAMTFGYIEAILLVAMFIPLALLALVAAVGFVFLFRIGWLLGAIAQGLILLACLNLYFQYRPIFIYPIMVYSIIMVLYLNSFEVRIAFQPRRDSGDVEAANER